MSIVAVEAMRAQREIDRQNTLSNSVRLYFRLIVISIKSQLQYRVSFVLMSFGNFASCSLEFLAIWALFNRFGRVNDWSLPEICMFYGIINCACAIAESFTRAFDVFPGMVKNGDFDKMLIRPRSTVLQMLGAEFQIMRVGRLLQGVLILLWGAAAVNIEWHAWQVGLLIFSMFGGVCLFSGLFVLYATASFWTVESLEIFNTLTYGGVETAQYPVTLYRPWFRWFFTLVVPLATINYFPMHAILGRNETMGSTFLFQCLSPLIGVILLLISLQVWKLGVRRYCSTGS